MKGSSREQRDAPLEMSGAEFRAVGHRLVDEIGDFLEAMPAGPVTGVRTPAGLQAMLGPGALPDTGEDPGDLVAEATRLLMANSLFNGHPRFFGFITSSAAPIGALADMLASAVNPNLGGWILSPVASEIERRTVRWIAQMTGYPSDAGGLLVSGGNVANFVGFWVGRRVRSPWNLREDGLVESGMRGRVYASRETHTWVQKAADLSGLGTNAIRWIETDAAGRMDVAVLRRRIESDLTAGDLPLIVVGTAGSVSTGAIDPLGEIADIAAEHGLWFHVDGAYGAPAAVLPEASPDLRALERADSIAIDPHKWLYAPLEAGCTLVRDATALRDTFSYHPPYYPDEVEAADDAPIYYHEYGPQNSRGFRALKVWLAMRQVGRQGYIDMIRDDIAMANAIHEGARSHPELEAFTIGLSIATFRYLPSDLDAEADGAPDYVDGLNRSILERMQNGGEAFVSNAVIGGRYALRACVVNFRTGPADVDALIELVVRLGRAADAELRPAALRGAAVP
jgi:glutamate/tyrosine decarboxylase-like PLP-dependent enzyme